MMIRARARCFGVEAQGASSAGLVMIKNWSPAFHCLNPWRVQAAIRVVLTVSEKKDEISESNRDGVRGGGGGVAGVVSRQENRYDQASRYLILIFWV